MRVQRRFRPNAWLTLLTVLLMALFIRLGVWQLERADIKQGVVAAYTERMESAPLELSSENIANIESYQRVSVYGWADSEHQILLDNKIYNGKAGFQVLLPVKIAASNKWILVNRGWVPMGSSRNILPDVSIDKSLEHFQGMVKLPLGDEFIIGEGNQWGTQWPQLIQWLDVSAAASHLGYEMVPYILLQSPDDDGGYVRDWKVVASSAEKSISYAVQWFAFAIILCGLFVFLNYKKIPPEGE